MTSVFLENLNDFIEPSQSCVNPIFVGKKNEEDEENKNGIVLSIEDDDMIQSNYKKAKRPNLILTRPDSNIAQVSLNDCLACSGCVTTAEAVLVQQQSIDKFYDALFGKGSKLLLNSRGVSEYGCVFMTISPEVLASLGNYFNVQDINKVLFALQQFFMIRINDNNEDNSGLGVDFVVNMGNIGTNISLVEAYEEFKKRVEVNQMIGWTKPPETTSISSNEAYFVKSNEVKVISYINDNDVNDNDDEMKIDNDNNVNTTLGMIPVHASLPMLSSVCPGWICYAEKTCPESLPYISTVKSGQQINGIVLKSELSKRMNILPKNIYHIGVMPCFDRKLEASRKDFVHSNDEYTETDIVLTSQEVLEIIQNEANLYGIDHHEYFHSFLNKNETENENETYNFNVSSRLPLNIQEFLVQLCGETIHSNVPSHFHNESGGYLEYIYRRIAKDEYNIDIDFNEPLPYRPGRNPDFEEVELKIDGETKLIFAKAYGFRNIQAIIRQLKRSKCKYDFVEIMACPSGCINGGGQIKGDHEMNSIIKERLNNVASIINNQTSSNMDNDLPSIIYNEICPDGPFSNHALELFHTFYHAIPKLEEQSPLTIGW